MPIRSPLNNLTGNPFENKKVLFHKFCLGEAEGSRWYWIQQVQESFNQI